MNTVTDADRKRLEFHDQLKPALEALADELERGFAPFWEGTAESLRTIITISGGALVASISIVQIFADTAGTPRAGWLLPACWIMFGVSIFGAMSAQAAVTGMRLLRMNAAHHATRAVLTDKVPDTDHALVTVQIIDRVQSHFNRDLKRFNRAINIVRVSFICAFATMIAFAIINLPF